jgi:hypothetical protein
MSAAATARILLIRIGAGADAVVLMLVVVRFIRGTIVFSCHIHLHHILLA